MFIGFKPKDGRFHIELGEDELGENQFIVRFYLFEALIVLVIIGLLIASMWPGIHNLAKWE